MGWVGIRRSGRSRVLHLRERPSTPIAQLLLSSAPMHRSLRGDPSTLFDGSLVCLAQIVTTERHVDVKRLLQLDRGSGSHTSTISACGPGAISGRSTRSSWPISLNLGIARFNPHECRFGLCERVLLHRRRKVRPSPVRSLRFRRPRSSSDGSEVGQGFRSKQFRC